MRTNFKASVFVIAAFLIGYVVNAQAASFSNWNSYFANVNDQLSSIFLDLSFHKKAPLKRYPKLAWYWIQMKSPKDNGLSSQSEYNALIKHEDALLDYLAKSPVVYVGRITTDGKREFYFYTDEHFDLESTLQNFVGNDPVYQFQMGQKNDRDWSQYLTVLYPSKHGLKQMGRD